MAIIGLFRANRQINRKKFNQTSVTFIYTIKVTNEGEIEGYAKEVKDRIPEGLEFLPDNETNKEKGE